MRDAFLFLALLVLPMRLSAAEATVASKPLVITVTTNNVPDTQYPSTITSTVVDFPLQDVRGALKTFPTLSGTNLYGWMYPLGIVDKMHEGRRALSLSICSCNTPSACYEIIGIRVAEDRTRLEVRSHSQPYAEEYICKYQARRDPKILEDLTQLLNNPRPGAP